MEKVYVLWSWFRDENDLWDKEMMGIYSSLELAMQRFPEKYEYCSVKYNNEDRSYWDSELGEELDHFRITEEPLDHRGA